MKSTGLISLNKYQTILSKCKHQFKRNFYASRKLFDLNNVDLLNIIQKIRNIGVIAHVDAGKTTTTERMLYYSGYTNSLGNVDDGNTIMDYMEQERERGITITSAAITFPWKNYQFNLIDTPGHVDFTIEVERSLRVLDGAIAIIDASAGVEAQTLTVWKQSNKYNIPRIAYVNKMDKLGANYDYCVKSIETKLSTIPLVVQLPIGKEKDFVGVIDLINMKKLTWNNSISLKNSGKSFESTNLDENDENYERAHKNRVKLVEKLADCNEEFAEILLEKYNLNYDKMNDNILLEKYIRLSNMKCLITPILCGSSFKNIGVQPLMDAIVKYLPNPTDLYKNNFSKYFDKSLYAVSFKIIHDHLKTRKRINSTTSLASISTSASSTINKTLNDLDDDEDILSFVRIYNGELITKSKVYNPAKQVNEKIDKIYVPFSNQLKQVNKITNGNIAIVSGLLKTTTGDILVTDKQNFEKASSKLEKENEETKKLMKIGIDIAPPVYFCTVEPNSESEEKRLLYALECLKREDPSLRVTINDEENLGQTTIQGMGELHLDIIKDRILKEYKLKVFFGPLNIAYKEMPTKETTKMINYEKNINEKKNTVQMELSIIPSKDYEFKSVNLIKKGDNFNDFPSEYLNAIDHGVKSALTKGVILRYPFVSTKVNLNYFNANKSISIPHISSAAYQCTINALKEAECIIIQPVMRVDITTSKEYSSRVYGDLTKKNAINLNYNEIGNIVNLSARLPLAKLSSYSSELRKLTSGNATFTIEFDSYEPITQKEFQELLEKKL